MLVIKCGGAAGLDTAAICADIAARAGSGEQMVLVHGGSKEANDLGERLSHPARFLTSPSGVQSRYTDAATLDVLTMAMAGRINPALVSRLIGLGVRAVGLSGVDGALVQARRKPANRAVVDGRVRVIHDDLTGKIAGVNAGLLRLLLDGGYVPVVSPPALDPVAGPLNVDADRMAAAIAAALQAECLVILSNVPGLLRDPADPSSLVTTVPPRGMPGCLGLAHGRMKLKLIAAREALCGGVGRVILGDGRLEAPIQKALAGRGTVLGPEALDEGGGT